MTKTGKFHCTSCNEPFLFSRDVKYHARSAEHKIMNGLKKTSPAMYESLLAKKQDDCVSYYKEMKQWEAAFSKFTNKH